MTSKSAHNVTKKATVTDLNKTCITLCWTEVEVNYLTTFFNLPKVAFAKHHRRSDRHILVTEVSAKLCRVCISHLVMGVTGLLFILIDASLHPSAKAFTSGLSFSPYYSLITHLISLFNESFTPPIVCDPYHLQLRDPPCPPRIPSLS